MCILYPMLNICSRTYIRTRAKNNALQGDLVVQCRYVSGNTAENTEHIPLYACVVMGLCIFYRKAFFRAIESENDDLNQSFQPTEHFLHKITLRRFAPFSLTYWYTLFIYMRARSRLKRSQYGQRSALCKGIPTKKEPARYAHCYPDRPFPPI